MALGTDLARSDSVIAVGIGRARRRVTASSPRPCAARARGTAWAAASAARSFGARPPMHLLAGLCFGFGGPAVATLVDGQLYVLLCPWLPLLARDWRRATSPEGRVVDGLRAGLWWTLSLLTSAYVGVAATLWVVGRSGDDAAPPGRAPGPGRRRSPSPRGWPTSSLLDRDHPRGLQGVSARKAMEVGSSELASLVSWAPAVPSDPHAVAAPLGFVTLALVAFAPVVLGAQRGWRLPALLGLVGVLLSLGPTLSLASGLPGAPWLLRPLAALPGGGWFRFPARLLWLPALGFGLVAARVASDLFDRRGRISLVLLPLASWMSWWWAARPRTAPRARAPAKRPAAGARGPLLDLFAPSPGATWTWSCGLPTAPAPGRSGTNRRSSPGVSIPTPAPTPERRSADGCTARSCPAHRRPPPPDSWPRSARGRVAVHPDTYTGPGAARVLQGLQRVLGPPHASSTDGGERIMLFAVPDPERTARGRAGPPRAGAHVRTAPRSRAPSP